MEDGDLGSTWVGAPQWLDGEVEPMTETLGRIHRGQLVFARATVGTRRLVARVRSYLAEALTDGDVDAVTRRVFPHAVVARVRTELESQPWLAASMAEVLTSLGFPGGTKMDAPRMRVVPHRAELEERAAPLFVVHRDTWYGCPQSQINVWLPMHPLPIGQSFAFYPDYFERPVVNGSGTFDYLRWTRDVGWHGTADVASYPQPTKGSGWGREQRFALDEGEVLLFAAHQLHGTKPNPEPGTTRFSLDVRVVVPDGPASPNVDNASTGADERLAREFFPLGQWSEGRSAPLAGSA